MITRPRRQNAKLVSLSGYSCKETTSSSLSTTPFRLPRRSEISSQRSPRDEKYCLENSNTSSPRPVRFDGPSFSQALIAPNCSPRLIATDPSDPIFRNLTRARTTAFETQQTSTHFPEVDPSPTPITARARTPAQTLTLSHAYTYPTTATHFHGSETSTAIEWTLSPHKHKNFDQKGRQRNQGPFSREFTVRVMAPNNWLRMKWGRQYRRYLPPLAQSSTMT